MGNAYKKIILLAGDIFILYLSLYITLELRDGTWNTHFSLFSATFVIWIIIFYIFELYNLHIAINNFSTFGRTIKAVGAAGLFSALFFYLYPDTPIAPKTNLAIYIAVFSILFLIWRRFYNWMLGSYLPKDRLAFVGYNGQVRELVQTLKQKPHLGFFPSLIISTKPIEGQIIPVTDDLEDLKSIIREQKITTIVLSESPHESKELRSALFECLHLKITILNLTDFYESVTGKVPITAINQMWFLENLSEGNKTLFDLFKRTYDIFLAAAILIATAPLWPLIGIAIKTESKGPIFFRQKRSGENNRHFTIIKFRTMTEDGNDGSPTKNGDSRVTSFGNFLRKTRIDEIPQVINIILGSMSFVGPRPEQPKLIEVLEKDIPFYKERMLVKPGLTGWDQVSGEYHSPSREDTIKKLQYDLYYIKNRSLYLDLSIILKTIATVLSRSGV